MTHWWAKTILAGLLALTLEGCTETSDTPDVTITGNSGPVTVVIPTGDGSAGGTAPCAATATAQQNGPVTPDCSSTVTPAPVVVTP